MTEHVRSASPREIAALVPMPALLRALGFAVNERTKRAPCRLHGGSNPSAFSWTDSGLWRCHSCGRGGDRIQLVRAIRGYSFKETIKFLASLAGVDYDHSQVSQTEIGCHERDRAALRSDAEVLLHLERTAWRAAQDIVLSLEAIRRGAGRRLDAIRRGDPERWRGETEDAWSTLAHVYHQMPRAAAAYAFASFASRRDRIAFALDERAREQLVDEALNAGYVSDECGRRIDVLL
jgi:hypothetical protein